MANPTSNFNWQMPTPTDLVTDLPADFEVFGQAVDSSMADLLGGTTGQILAKNSNTNMDFVWIANDQGDITGITASSPLTGGGTSGAVTVGIQDATTAQKGAVQLENSTSSTSTTTAAVPASVKSAYDLANAAIPKSLVDAAGDLIYATANDTPARLAIGTAGQVLKVNSGATAPEWGTVSAGDFKLIGTYTMPGTATTYSLNSVFTSTYTNYMLVGKIVGASTGNIFIKLRASGSDASGSDYNSMIAYYGVTQSDGTSKFASSSSGFYIDNVGDDNSCSIMFQRPQEAVKTFYLQNGMNYFNSVNGYWRVGGGQHNLATAYDGFTISGGSNLSGTFQLYGLAK